MTAAEKNFPSEKNEVRHAREVLGRTTCDFLDRTDVIALYVVCLEGSLRKKGELALIKKRRGDGMEKRRWRREAVGKRWKSSVL